MSAVATPSADHRLTHLPDTKTLHRGLDAQLWALAGWWRRRSGFMAKAAERADAVVQECAASCQRVIEAAVGPEAAREGGFTGLDREGRVRRFPLARVSAAVLHVSPPGWVNLAHLGMRAADVKRRAKQHGPGTVLVEQV